MATTTNFGWTTPDDTDLVKDGAAAIRTLGSAIDTSLVDLKGGTTGQVLSKTSNTDMDFTWVAQDDTNAIQNAIIDAKGDLIVGTAADTPARLAVGTNGYVLTADSAESSGIKWAAVAASPASASATVATNQAIASATYSDLPTAGPSVTLTTGTKALVIVTALLESSPSGTAFMGYEVSGATTISATDTTALIANGTPTYRMSAVSRLSSLTAGSNTFTAKYRRSTANTFGYYTNREICVIDLGS